MAAHFSERGFNVSFSEGHCRYDLMAERDGKIYRVQVKSCSVIRCGGYVFWSRKKTRYKKNDFDILACVALDIKIIGFLHPRFLIDKCKVFLRPPNAKMRTQKYTISDCTLEKVLKEIS